MTENNDEALNEKKDRFGSVLGQVLRDAREKTGDSQEKYANKLLIDRTTISLIERGKQIPNVWTLFRLAEYLDVSASELIARTEKQLKEIGY